MHLILQRKLPALPIDLGESLRSGASVPELPI